MLFRALIESLGYLWTRLSLVHMTRFAHLSRAFGTQHISSLFPRALSFFSMAAARLTCAGALAVETRHLLLLGLVQKWNRKHKAEKIFYDSVIKQRMRSPISLLWLPSAPKTPPEFVSITVHPPPPNLVTRHFVIKGCLWLTRGLIISKMKADNELAISLPVLFKSVKKWECVKKKKLN